MVARTEPRYTGQEHREILTHSPYNIEEDVRAVVENKVSWGAIFAGVTLALVVQLVLNMLGVGIGAATIDPVDGQTPSAFAFTAGAGIWWVVSGVIAAFIGGLTAGRLAGKPKKTTGGWHGLMSWAFSTLVIFYILTSTVSMLAGNTFNAMSGMAGGIAQATGTAAQVTATGTPETQDQQAMNTIRQEIDQMMEPGTAQQVQEAMVAIGQAMVSGEQAQIEQARQEAAQAIAQAEGVSQAEAQNMLQQYEQQLGQTWQNVTQQTAEGAEVAANTVSQAALYAAIALILGALAAWFGGTVGTVHRPAYDEYEEHRKSTEEKEFVH